MGTGMKQFVCASFGEQGFTLASHAYAKPPDISNEAFVAAIVESMPNKRPGVHIIMGTAFNEKSAPKPMNKERKPKPAARPKRGKPELRTV